MYIKVTPFRATLIPGLRWNKALWCYKDVVTKLDKEEFYILLTVHHVMILGK